MAHRRIAGVFGTLMLGLSNTHAFAYSLDFTMINDTNQPIVEFMASATTESRYHGFNDVYVPADGGQQRFTFNEGAVGNDCYIDMKLKFQGGQYWTINHVYLCSVRTITMSVSNGKVTYATAE